MNRVIKIGKELVPVSEEVYQAYYKMDRRMRYLEEDVKVGKSVENPETGEITFLPSKEDSIQRLMDQGEDFASEQIVEDIVSDKATLLLLQKAVAELDREEQELIKAIYYQEKTTREIAEEKEVSQPAIVKRHQKAIKKLKKYFL